MSSSNRKAEMLEAQNLVSTSVGKQAYSLNLLDLPLEIRLLVYRMVLGDPQLEICGKCFCYPVEDYNQTRLCLLYVCSQIHNEAMSDILSRCQIYIISARQSDRLKSHKVLCKGKGTFPRSIARQVRSVRLYFQTLFHNPRLSGILNESKLGKLDLEHSMYWAVPQYETPSIGWETKPLALHLATKRQTVPVLEQKILVKGSVHRMKELYYEMNPQSGLHGFSRMLTDLKSRCQRLVVHVNLDFIPQTCPCTDCRHSTWDNLLKGKEQHVQLVYDWFTGVIQYCDWEHVSFADKCA